MNNTKDRCEGCLSYQLPTNYSQKKIRKCAIMIPFISNIVKCPCIDCLVKMVCNDMCETFKAYRKVSDLRHKFENKGIIKRRDLND